MKTARFRALLLEAVAAGSAGFGCAAPSPPLTHSSTEADPSASARGEAPAEPPRTPEAPPSSAEPSTLPASSASTSALYPVPAELTGDCPNGWRNVLRDLKPASAFDYAELRQRQGTGGFQSLLAHGSPCRTATDADACRRMLQEPSSGGFGAGCRPGLCDFQVVVTDRGGVTRYVSSQELGRFLGPIDTASEALLIAFANKHWVLACDRELPRKSGPSWTLTSNEMIADCPVVTADLSLSIAPDGSVRVLGTTNQKKTGMCVGRRPPGLRAPAVAPPARSVATYLAECAELEAASIVAFEHLASELERLDAPAHLTRSCRRAASDERRHARIMARLAKRFGSDVSKPEFSELRLHTAETLAHDNAIEGCVRETFGAAVGLFQAEHAENAHVRAALTSIATDEMRHAELAWNIAEWAERQLEPSEKRSLAEARRQAIDELRAEVAVEPDAELMHTLGLPSRAAALHMLAVFERRLWTA